MAQAPARPGPLATRPLTQLDERLLTADLDHRTFSLTFAQPVAVRDLLLLLVRGTNLSIVPDPDIAGSFIGDLKNVTVRQALGLILPSIGLDYSVDGTFIRVFRREFATRIFDVNYLGAARAAVISAGSDSSAVRIDTTTTADLFAEIGNGVRTLLSEHGVYNVDRKAGLLQVSDFPERLDRVAVYLDAVHERAQRQVQIEARVLEVQLNDATAASLDWNALLPALTAPARGRAFFAALRAGDTERFVDALRAQGTVATIADPKVLALNNEAALVRAVDGGRSFTLVVTPQIAADGAVTLAVKPSVELPSATGARASEGDRRETDMLARVANGETIVIAGFTRETIARERKSGGLKGGWFGRSTVETRRRVELVILLTPRIVTVAGTE